MMGGGWCNLILDQKNQKKTTINQLAREKPNQRSGKKSLGRPINAIGGMSPRYEQCCPTDILMGDLPRGALRSGSFRVCGLGSKSELVTPVG